MREQHDLAIRKLDGIVVRVWIVQIDLPEPSHRVTDVFRLSLEKAQPKSSNLTLDFAFKHDLGARKKAHGHLGFSNCREPACRGIPKFGRDQLISDLCGSRCNSVQAVVAHGMELLSVSAPPTCSTISRNSRRNNEANNSRARTCMTLPVLFRPPPSVTPSSPAFR